MDIAIGVLIFLITVLIIEGGFFLFRSIVDPEKRRIRRQLKLLSAQAGINPATMDITRKRRSLSKIPWLNQLLWKIPFFQKIDLLLQQSDCKYPFGVFVLISFVLVFLSFLIASTVMKSYLISLPMSAVSGMMPFLFLTMKKKLRMQKFGRQLPDALDLIARSLKAGHALSGGMQLIGQEFDDPIGTEFDKVLDEINFGISVEAALINLTERVDCPDLKFFAISIIIQRETGGNLVEILEEISRLIRERVKLQGRIRTLSAEGKFSAIVLLGIPLFVVLALSFMNPDYIKILIVDPLGKMLVAASLFMVFMGVIMMKKMIAIKV